MTATLRLSKEDVLDAFRRPSPNERILILEDRYRIEKGNYLMIDEIGSFQVVDIERGNKSRIGVIVRSEYPVCGN